LKEIEFAKLQTSVTNYDCFTIFCGLSSIRAFNKHYGSIAIFYTFVGQKEPLGGNDRIDGWIFPLDLL
jgi:hypothetical protein